MITQKKTLSSYNSTTARKATTRSSALLDHPNDIDESQIHGILDGTPDLISVPFAKLEQDVKLYGHYVFYHLVLSRYCARLWTYHAVLLYFSYAFLSTPAIHLSIRIRPSCIKHSISFGPSPVPGVH